MLVCNEISERARDEMCDVDPLTQQVKQRFHQSGYPELRRIEVVNTPGRVMLRGNVETYFLKQLAQSLAMSVPKVDVLENQVVVK